MPFRCKNIKKRVHYEAKRKMTILSFFTLTIQIRRLWTNLYHKEDHFLKIWLLLHYFLEIYSKMSDFALFFKKIFLPTQKKTCPFKQLVLLTMKYNYYNNNNIYKEDFLPCITMRIIHLIIIPKKLTFAKWILLIKCSPVLC